MEICIRFNEFRIGRSEVPVMEIVSFLPYSVSELMRVSLPGCTINRSPG